MLRPSTVDEAAAVLTERKAPVHPTGSGSRGIPPAGVTLSTAGLARIVEHNPGDFTAVLEAGVPVADAQAAFAAHGQWLAVDPPAGGTVGGLVATADSGPARHRYGGVRDLVIGMTVVLSDGTVARSGGKVIKNVAGYDLAKLFTGSYGTLGLVAEVAVRLHPVPARTATLVGSSADPADLAVAGAVLAARPLEATCLDVAWAGGAGRLLVRFAGDTAESRAHAADKIMTDLVDVRVITDDEPLWEAQRAGQRSGTGYVVKVSGRPDDLARVLELARDNGFRVVGRAALGLYWLTVDDPERVRTALAPRGCTVVDGLDRLPDGVDPWPAVEPGALALMHRVKARFDPARIFRPGTFVGGI